MRSLNFRDNVLWAVAYKMGLDPTKKLLKAQAAAYVVSINGYVRRLWDAADFPEWTPTGRFTPDLNHLVSYDATAQDLDQVGPPKLGKVLRVYLVDPRTTWAPPVDTPFRLGFRGVHVGFEHGANVWIKFIARCPQFTSREWNPNDTFNKDELVYSPTSGECYMSKVNGNRGNDPSVAVGGANLPPLTTEILQRFIPANPGIAGQPGILDISLAGSEPLPDPPGSGYKFDITILGPTTNGPNILATATFTATGAESLADIAADLMADLESDPSLSDYTITRDAHTIRLEANQGFTATGTYQQSLGDTPIRPLVILQVQVWIIPVPATPGQPQQTKLSLSDDQVVQGGIYRLVFRKVDGIEHTITYTSAPEDGAVQILVGLMNAVQAARVNDPFFNNVASELDPAAPSLTFTIAQSGDVSVDGEIDPGGSPYWIFIPFPFDLVEPVVRGTVADAKGEQGQSDKAQMDEQLVPNEMQLRISGKQGKQLDELTDQQRAKARYGIG